MQVASIQGFSNNPELVLDFYNQRRKQLKQVEPNAAHVVLAELEKKYEVSIVTQNVDDLHERAGSKNVLHLHGELRKVRSIGNPADIKIWTEDIKLGDLCDHGYQLRPHIVWFGEDVPMIEKAVAICETADILMIIGTSMQVYPASSLMNFVKTSIPIYYIDPKPAKIDNKKLTVIAKPATTGLVQFLELIKD